MEYELINLNKGIFQKLSLIEFCILGFSLSKNPGTKEWEIILFKLLKLILSLWMMLNDVEQMMKREKRGRTRSWLCYCASKKEEIE